MILDPTQIDRFTNIVDTHNNSTPLKATRKMRESVDPEYAKVTIIISTPDSNVPTKIQQTQINDQINIDELKRIEVKKQSDKIEGDRAKRDRQDNIGLCIVFIFMVSIILVQVYLVMSSIDVKLKILTHSRN